MEKKLSKQNSSWVKKMDRTNRVLKVEKLVGKLVKDITS